MAVIGTFQHKIYFLLHFGSSAAGIFFNGILKLCQTVYCVMEVRYCLMQTGCRILLQQFLKMPECHCAFIEIFFLFHRIIAGSIFHKHVHPPISTVFQFTIGFTGMGIYDIQRLPFRISSVFTDFLLQKCSHAYHILHQPLRIFENLMVHSLQNIVLFFVPYSAYQKISIINMAAAIRLYLLFLSIQTKFIRNLHQLCFIFSHTDTLILSHHRL